VLNSEQWAMMTTAQTRIILRQQAPLEAIITPLRIIYGAKIVIISEKRELSGVFLNPTPVGAYQFS
jgi:hypothetical protein